MKLTCIAEDETNRQRSWLKNYKSLTLVKYPTYLSDTSSFWLKANENKKMNVPSLPGTATLLEDLDSKWIFCNRYTSTFKICVLIIFVAEKVIVVLRDGRTLIGFLRSVDQFANLVLHRTIERIHVGKEYGDIPRGVFIVRGENVALLGEIVSKLILKFT